MAHQLLDAYERPIQTKKLTEEQASPTTRAVRRSNAMHPAAGLNPVRLANILRDSIDGDPEPYLALAEDMEERNEHYAGVLGTRKRQVAGLEVTVEAADDTTEAIAHADLIRSVVDREQFGEEVFDILDAVGKGFSCTEILWDRSENQWMPKRLSWRDPRWFQFDQETGEIPMLMAQSGPEPLKPFGWIFHCAKIKSGLPIRGGLARAAAWNFMFKAFSLRDWAIFCEAYGQPLRLGKYGPNASEEDKAKLLSAVSNIGVDFAAIVPEGMMIEFIEAKMSGNHELYEKRADWMDRQVSKVVLGQTATTDAQAGGYATGTVHNDVREDIETADARQLQATLNRDLAVPLVQLNYGPLKAYPKIRIKRKDQVDVKQLVDNVVKLVPFGLKVGMAAMRDKIGMADPADDEELLVAPAAVTFENDEAAGRRAAQAAASAIRPDDAIDRAVDRLTGDDWEIMMNPIVAGLDSELSAAGSAEEARDILNRRLETMGVAAFTDLLARAAFAARLAGEAEEDLQ